MSALALSAAAPVAALLVRQLVVLAATVRSARFLRHGFPAPNEAADGTPTFFVVVPVLREATVIADTVAHFEALVHEHAAQVVVVTTAREAAEAARDDTRPGTAAVVEALAGHSKFVHLHYPDPRGLKGDQLNYAARYCAATLLGDVRADDAFVVCYDADSRPPLDSLTHFEQAVATHGNADVFHQSAQFERRRAESSARRSRWSWLAAGIGEGAALRANRFVLGFEMPRLVNRTTAGPLKRWLCSYVYAHVTGHGLCLRLSLLLDLPFPACSPLEDMHYSFYLGSRNLPMVAVPSLDRAEVPHLPAAQIQQAARWFFGPARARRYLRDPATQPGHRPLIMAMSALGSAMEWLGCAIVPAATLLVLSLGPGPARWAAAGLAATYAAQLLVTDTVVGAGAPLHHRGVRLLLCPLAATLFGLGGFIGAVRLLRGGSGVGKTERR